MSGEIEKKFFFPCLRRWIRSEKIIYMDKWDTIMFENHFGSSRREKKKTSEFSSIFISFLAIPYCNWHLENKTCIYNVESVRGMVENDIKCLFFPQFLWV